MFSSYNFIMQMADLLLPQEISVERKSKLGIKSSSTTMETANCKEAGEEGLPQRIINGITPKSKNGMPDPQKTFRAVAARNYRQLDPVTGDAACQMRVPFMLDAMNIISMSACTTESLILGFSSMYGPEFNMLPVVAASRKGTLPEAGTMPDHYFSLFYPLSVTRQRADDSLGFLIEDQPERITYSYKKANRWKSAAAQFNVDYMRKLAAFQTKRVGDKAPVIGQISTMFRESKIEMRKGGFLQPILPIFTAEYFILQNEYLHGRSIVLVLSRWGYDVEGGQYHFGTQVYMYSPNQAETLSDKRFELVQAAPNAQEAVTVIHAFNMFPLDQAERRNYEETANFAGEEKFFNSPDNAEFAAGFARCDLHHLLLMFAAGHRPAPSSAVAQGFERGQTREYIEQKHRANTSGVPVRDYRLTDHTSLLGEPDTNISDEYFAYKKMATRYGITDIQYVSETAEMRKTFYIAPLGCAGESVQLREWTTMPAEAFNYIAMSRGVKAQRDRIIYLPKLYTRACQPIPFSVVHNYVSNFNEEQKRAKELKAKFPRTRKFGRDVEMELVSGTFYEKSRKRKGQPVKKQLALWTVGETIDEKHQTSIQYPDSQTELGYETPMTTQDRRVLANKMIEIARTSRAVGDIVEEVIERAIKIAN
jgi:hypothetical protein